MGSPAADNLVPDLAALTATSTAIGAAPSSTVYGQSVTLTATVAAQGSTTPTGGTVTFTSGTTTLGSASLVAGTATLATTLLPAGTDQVTASYDGADSTFGTASRAAPPR